MRYLGKIWAALGANKARRMALVLALLSILFALQVLTQRSRAETTIEDPSGVQRLQPILEQQSTVVQDTTQDGASKTNGEVESSSQDNKTTKKPVTKPKLTLHNQPISRTIKARQSQWSRAKDEILKNFSSMDTKQLQRLMKLLDSTKNPHSVPDVRINQALQALKIRLLEEVSGKEYPSLLSAAQNARALSDRPRPESFQIVIATTWRSGSTFVEELLESHPAVYNHYEPLMQFGLHQIRDGPNAVKAQNLVKSLLACNYNGNDEYINTAVKIRDMFNRNKALWHSCSSEDYGDAMCYNEVFLKGACKLFPWATMKLVRLRLKLLRPVLEDQSLNTKIVFLVRDPRGVINSRTDTVKWCNEKDCYDPAMLCSDMDDDLSAAVQLQKDFPGRLYVLRYEDMSLNPYNKTKELLDYLGMDFDPKMKEFLDSHTTNNYDKPWSTSRESKKRVTYWVSKLSKTKLKSVQDSCSDVMKKFGYLPITSATDIKVSDVLGPLVLPKS